MINYSLSDIRKFSGEDALVGRFYYRKVATYFSFVFAHTKITPNMISFISLIFGVISAFFFAFGSTPYLYLAAFFSQIAMIMDYSDGQIARIKGMGSKRGAWFDVVNGAVQNNLIILGILIGIFRTTQSVNALFFGFLSLFAWNMMGFVHLTQMLCMPKQALRDTKLALKVKKGLRIKPQDFAIGGDVYFLIIGIAALLGKLFYALIFMAIVGNIYWISSALYIFIVSKEK